MNLTRKTVAALQHGFLVAPVVAVGSEAAPQTARDAPSESFRKLLLLLGAGR